MNLNLFDPVITARLSKASEGAITEVYLQPNGVIIALMKTPEGGCIFRAAGETTARLEGEMFVFKDIFQAAYSLVEWNPQTERAPRNFAKYIQHFESVLQPAVMPGPPQNVPALEP